MREKSVTLESGRRKRLSPDRKRIWGAIKKQRKKKKKNRRKEKKEVRIDRGNMRSCEFSVANKMSRSYLGSRLQSGGKEARRHAISCGLFD